MSNVEQGPDRNRVAGYHTGDDAFDAAVRDLKGARLAMKWAHHVSSETKKQLVERNHTFPLLPDRGTAELREALGDDHAALAQDTLSCETGHNGTKIERGHWQGYPDWPDEVSYEARGYGPYPFWSLRRAEKRRSASPPRRSIRVAAAASPRPVRPGTRARPRRGRTRGPAR